jgi:hypothetical protein
MVQRHGRCVAAHFGSAAAEAAVCLKTVGIADRFDRTTLELRGAPSDVDEALAALSELSAVAWWVRTTPHEALVRCEHGDSPRCSAAILGAEGIAVVITNDYAAIGVLGPQAEELLRCTEFDGPAGQPIVLHDARGSLELLIDARRGEVVWAQLLTAGAQFGVACIGLDAVEHLAASRRVGRAV